ncbi:MAG: hypothetical protein C4297_10830 [Gemmataceae bacterium]
MQQGLEDQHGAHREDEKNQIDPPVQPVVTPGERDQRGQKKRSRRRNDDFQQQDNGRAIRHHDRSAYGPMRSHDAGCTSRAYLPADRWSSVAIRRRCVF